MTVRSGWDAACCRPRRISSPVTASRISGSAFFFTAAGSSSFVRATMTSPAPSGIPRPGARRGEVESLIVLDVHVDPFEADMKGEHPLPSRLPTRPILSLFCWFHVS